MYLELLKALLKTIVSRRIEPKQNGQEARNTNGNNQSIEEKDEHNLVQQIRTKHNDV